MVGHADALLCQGGKAGQLRLLPRVELQLYRAAGHLDQSGGKAGQQCRIRQYQLQQAGRLAGRKGAVSRKPAPMQNGQGAAAPALQHGIKAPVRAAVAQDRLAAVKRIGLGQPDSLLQQRRQRYAAGREPTHVARGKRKNPLAARRCITKAFVPLALAAQHTQRAAGGFHAGRGVLHQQGKVSVPAAAAVHADGTHAAHPQRETRRMKFLHLQAVQSHSVAVPVQHRVHRRAAGPRRIQLGQQSGEILRPLACAERPACEGGQRLQLLRPCLFQMGHVILPFCRAFRHRRREAVCSARPFGMRPA